MLPLAHEVAPDGAIAATVVDPAAPAGDLLADVAAFSSLEACIKQRAPLDAVVSDALASIGYGTFVRDACRVLEAAKTRDATRCALIDASALKYRCESVVAVVARRADGCPLAATSSEDGRDSVCVAWSLRSRALCRGADARSRTRCEAVVAGDAKPCASIALAEDRRDCARDVERWRSIVAEGGAPAIAIKAPSATLEVHGADGRADPALTSFDASGVLSRGVVVVKGPRRSSLRVGDLEALGSPRAASPSSRAKLSFALDFGPEASSQASLRDFSLSVPGAAELSCAPGRCELSVKDVSVDASRGGAVSLSVVGRVGVSPQAFQVRATLSTFVRDVVVEAAPAPR